MLSFVLLLQDDGLTLGDVLRDIPHDVPAMVVYLLVGGFIYAIWRGSRSRPKS